MTMHSDHHEPQGFIHTATGQTTVLVAVLVVVTAIAWLYIW
jgi:hypothetical protein